MDFFSLIHWDLYDDLFILHIPLIFTIFVSTGVKSMDMKCSFCDNETKVLCPECQRPACRSHAPDDFCIQLITGGALDICIVCEYEQTGTVKRLYSWNTIETSHIRKCLRFLSSVNDDNLYYVPNWLYEWSISIYEWWIERKCGKNEEDKKK